jgi:hypothetical protein
MNFFQRHFIMKVGEQDEEDDKRGKERKKEGDGKQKQ